MSVLLIALTAGVVQLALFLHVRNTLQDAVNEGARTAGLWGQSPLRGVERARGLITLAVGEGYATDITMSRSTWEGRSAVTLTVHAPLPLLGTWGPPAALTLSGIAPVEQVGVE